MIEKTLHGVRNNGVRNNAGRNKRNKTMNRIYKLKFDKRRNELVVVSEITA
ncbi:TPA: ESPR domain-containing protein, partial [Salmonella enterica subsp. enterica serovar Manhattan]|nr:ESPR domain-containing protein [Salmonella enterica subsp. enterica serovar Manhattan]